MEKILKILLDLDGCVTAPSGNTDPSVTSGLQGIREIVARANGTGSPEIGACTGREGRWAAAMLYSLGAIKGWSVVESGLFLFDAATGETKQHPALTPEILELFQERIPPIIQRICQKHSGVALYKGNEINGALELKPNAGIGISQLYAIVTEELQDFSERGLVNIHKSSIAVDISPAGIDKGAGVRFLSTITGINPADMLGIGDSSGDFPMFNVVGHLGCPANATQECKNLVKSRGGHVSERCYSAGVLDVIKRYEHLMF